MRTLFLVIAGVLVSLFALYPEYVWADDATSGHWLIVNDNPELLITNPIPQSANFGWTNSIIDTGFSVGEEVILTVDVAEVARISEVEAENIQTVWDIDGQEYQGHELKIDFGSPGRKTGRVDVSDVAEEKLLFMDTISIFVGERPTVPEILVGDTTVTAGATEHVVPFDGRSALLRADNPVKIFRVFDKR